MVEVDLNHCDKLEEIGMFLVYIKKRKKKGKKEGI